MKNNTILWLFSAMLFGACSQAEPQAPAPEEEPSQPVDIDSQSQFTQLFWEDNFDGDQLDETVWWIQNTDSYNNELQCYKHNNGNVTMGVEPVSGNRCLVITAKRDTCSHGRYITSGKVST
ncbi:MAG: hypothetical protein J6Y77_02740, partial [Paludibacteraceae bacterium]|nr:hypothetical protein [Paludibacteraceae bacterium]